MPAGAGINGHLLLAQAGLQTRLQFRLEIDRVIEQDDTTITNRLERGDVTPIERSADAGAHAGAGELHFRMRARPQPRR